MLFTYPKPNAHNKVLITEIYFHQAALIFNLNVKLLIIKGTEGFYVPISNVV